VKTTKEVAAEIGLSIWGVLAAARRLGFKKRGRDYIFSDEDVAKLRGRNTTIGWVPGRPRKGDNRWKPKEKAEK
jgi:hypothetical protein